MFHGKDYSSSGATSIRKDIKGYNVTDRLRLFGNTLFLTGTFENLQNNTSGYEISTTTYKTMNTSVSLFPSSTLPNITIGYVVNQNTNTVNPLDTNQQLAQRAIDEETKRYFVQMSYDFSLWGRHNTTLSVDIANKDDRTPKNQDIKSMNGFLLINTTHTFPLESTVGLSLSKNTIPQLKIDSSSGTPLAKLVLEPLDYSTITLNARYKLYKDILKLSATFAPTFGDFERTMIESSLQYSFAQNQALVLQAQFIANKASKISTQENTNDSFISLLYRIDF